MKMNSSFVAVIVLAIILSSASTGDALSYNFVHAIKNQFLNLLGVGNAGYLNSLCFIRVLPTVSNWQISYAATLWCPYISNSITGTGTSQRKVDAVTAAATDYSNKAIAAGVATASDLQNLANKLQLAG